MSLEEKVWDHSSFSTNQERLVGSDIAAEFLARVLAQAKRKHLLSREQFTVDGTLTEAWASVKSIKPKDPNDGPPSAGSGGRNKDVYLVHSGESFVRHCSYSISQRIRKRVEEGFGWMKTIERRKRSDISPQGRYSVLSRSG